MVLSEPIHGPSLTVTNASMPTASTAVISGTATDPLGVAAVVVNGVEAALATDGTWTATVPSDGQQASILVTDTRGLTIRSAALPTPFTPGATAQQPVTTAPGSVPVPKARCTLTGGTTQVKFRRSLARNAHVTVNMRAECTRAGVVSITASFSASRPSSHKGGGVTTARTATLVHRRIAVASDHAISIAFALPRRLLVLLRRGARISGHATLALAGTSITRIVKVPVIAALN